MQNDFELFKKLVAQGANTGDRDANNGWNVLHYAAFGGSLEITKALMTSGASPNLGTGSAGITPLHIAVAREHFEVTQYLVSNKANVNAADRDGWTPLHWAVLGLQKDTVCLLLANGANERAKAANGASVLDLLDAAVKENQAKNRTTAEGQVQVAPEGGMVVCSRCDGTGQRSEQERQALISAWSAQNIGGTGVRKSPDLLTCPACNGVGQLPDARRRAAIAAAEARVNTLQAQLDAPMLEQADQLRTIIRAFDASKLTDKSKKIKQDILARYGVANTGAVASTQKGADSSGKSDTRAAGGAAPTTDVLITTSGTEWRGKVEKLENGDYVVTDNGMKVTFGAARVKSVIKAGGTPAGNEKRADTK